jgi:prophage tail gpP-like protein
MSADAESITILIGGMRVEAAEDVEIVSDLYTPEGSFSLPVAPGSVIMKGSDLVRVQIGGRDEMVGILGRATESGDHSSHTLQLTGRTLAGLLKDSYITSWSAPPKTLVLADAKYTADIPHLNRFPAEFADEAKGANTHHHAADIGDSVFMLLSEYARNRGLVFWIRGDGTRVYGKVVTGGAATFTIDKSNILKYRRVTDWDALHSDIILVSDNESEGHTKTSVTNDLAPIYKPFVACFNGYSSDLEKQAKNYVRQEKMRALQLEYVVQGFRQAGKPWAVNTLVQVDDPWLGVKGTYVSNRVAKRRDRSSGSITTITLGPLLEDPFKAYQKHGRKLRHTRGGL